MPQADEQKAALKSAPRIEPRSSRRRVLWTGTLLLAVAVWMFFLGILVGRGTAPVRFDIDRLEQELASLREALQEKEQQLLASAQAPESELGFSFYDDLKESEERATVAFTLPPAEPEPPLESAQAAQQSDFNPGAETATAVQPPEPPESAAPDRSDSAQPAAQPKTSLKKETFAGTRVAQAPPRPSPAPPTEAAHQKPRTAPSAGSNLRGPLTVQVAAVESAGTAQEMVAKLKQLGYAAHQSFAKIPGQGLRYRIRVGNFSNPGDAQSMVRRLKQDNYNAIIVRR